MAACQISAEAWGKVRDTRFVFTLSLYGLPFRFLAAPYVSQCIDDCAAPQGSDQHWTRDSSDLSISNL